jgi:hypothetical protein
LRTLGNGHGRLDVQAARGRRPRAPSRVAAMVGMARNAATR